MKNTFAYYLTYLYKNFLNYSTSLLKEKGISYGQLPFILYIGNHPGCTQSELTARLHLDWGYSQRSIVRLADSGLVIRTREGDNRKNNHLSLTLSGEDIFSCAHGLFSSWDEKYLDSLSQEEKDTMVTLMSKIAENTLMK